MTSRCAASATAGRPRRPTKRERKRLPLSNSLPLLRAATRSTGSRPRFRSEASAGRGERYRGSTKETNETRAQKAAALKLAATIKGSDPLDRKPPTLREYSKDFLQWVETGRLEADSRRYYRNGWRLLEQTKIAGMRMDQITKDEVEKLQFPGSASNGNNALRTLRRMYSKAK